MLLAAVLHSTVYSLDIYTHARYILILPRGLFEAVLVFITATFLVWKIRASR